MDNEYALKLELAKKRKVYATKLLHSFDATVLGSRPTKEQSRFLDDILATPVRWAVASNRCLAEGTQVATPRGPIPIEDIKVGDTVYDEYGKEIEVLDTFDNGIREVVELLHRGTPQAVCTPDHQWQTENINNGEWKRKRADELSSNFPVRRVEVDPELGSVDVPTAYEIGALLGDGCCRESRKYKRISSGDDRVPRHINPNARKLHPKTYTYCLGDIHVEYYDEWLKGKYSHEKFIDLDVVKTWNRESVLKLMAGLIDTYGSVKYSEKYSLINMAIGMQAYSALEFIQWAFLTLFQYECKIGVDNRDKYVNGPVYIIRIRNSHVLRRALKELDKYMVVKGWKDEFEKATSPRFNPSRTKLKVGDSYEVRTFDIHVNSPTNLFLLANGLVTSNSGKSAGGAREAAWVFSGEHPHVDLTTLWGNRPRLMLILGKKSEQMETSLWEKKIKPFLDPSTYKEVRTGNTLQKVIGIGGKAKGNIILFQSHNNPREARKNIQGYDAEWVWIDEMPEDATLVSELITRIITTNGRFIATFTPLVYNAEVKRMVESADGNRQKRYKLLLTDNPALQDKLEEVLSDMRSLSANEADFRARVYGEWITAGIRVSKYDPDRHYAQLPDNYDVTWRHVAGIDPSASGMTGLVLLAESPQTGLWYVVKAKYMQGDAAFLLVDEVEKELAGRNIYMRVCDPNPAGYYKELARRGISYTTVEEKAGRKSLLIDAANTALLRDRVKLTEHAHILEEELNTCSYADESEGKIVAASKYHTFDAFQYAIDRLPEFDPEMILPTMTFNQVIRRQAADTKRAKAKAKREGSIRIEAVKRRRIANRNRSSRLRRRGI